VSGPSSEDSSTSGWWVLAALPGVALLLLVFALPFLVLAENSLHLDEGLAQVSAEFTLSNYFTFLTDPFYLEILARTVLMGLIVVAGCAVLAYPVAYFVARADGVVRTCAIFFVVAPLLISLVIRNLGMFPVLGESGLVNTVLRWLGLVRDPLHLVNNLTGVEIGLIHALLPLMVLSLVVAIQTIDHDVELAAANLGAPPLRVFTRVVFPLSRPGLISGSMLVFTVAISAYTTPVMLGGNRVLVMSTFLAKEMLNVLNYAFAATCAVILVTTSLLLGSLALRRAERYGAA
jgi:putative spermidine/putrescine transport system permease protein